jgi:DNA-binding CsgD family transcriptional regulator
VIDSTKLSHLLRCLYDASAAPVLWPTFLDNVSAVTNSHAAALVMHSRSGNSHAVYHSWNLDPEADRLYQEHYGAIDLWAARGLAKPTGYVCQSEQLCSKPEIRRTEIYNDFMLRFDIEHGLFGVIENNGDRWASISFYRDTRAQGFGNEEVEIVQFLAPHIHRAFALYLQFSQLQAHSASLERALSHFATGVVMLGVGAKIIFMNAKALRVVNANDGLAVVNGYLRAENSAEAAELNTKLQRATADQGVTGFTKAASVFISRRGRPPLQINVLSLDIQTAFAFQSARAVVFIRDPLDRNRPPIDLLKIAYGMTSAESRIALLLADGISPRQISEKLGVSIHTVRTQIKSVYAKANVRRQSELVRVLLGADLENSR